MDYSGSQFLRIEEENLDPRFRRASTGQDYAVNLDAATGTRVFDEDVENAIVSSDPVDQRRQDRFLYPAQYRATNISEQASSPEASAHWHNNDQQSVAAYEAFNQMSPRPPLRTTHSDVAWQPANGFVPYFNDPQHGQNQQYLAYRTVHTLQPPTAPTNPYFPIQTYGTGYSAFRLDSPNVAQRTIDMGSGSGESQEEALTTPAVGLGELLSNMPPVQNVDPWNREVYNPGDRYRSNRSAPPNVGASRRHSGRSRRSAATSISSGAFSCAGCGDGFGSRHELNHHRRWHGERPHVCEECPADFVMEKDLRRHMRSRHEAERFYCLVFGCKHSYPKGVSRYDHLKRHYETQHPDQEVPSHVVSMTVGG